MPKKTDVKTVSPPGGTSHDASEMESHVFCSQIISSARNGIIMYGTDLRYRVWNPMMEKISGISAEQVIGKHPLELFPFLKESGIVTRLERALAGEVQDAVEFRFSVSENGGAGWSIDTSGPLKDHAARL